jgi:excisionase family DNA binding protein
MDTATETPAPAERDEYLTVAEVARRLRVTPMTIYTEIHDGRLDAIRVGRKRIRIPVAAYAAYVAASREAPQPAPVVAAA